MSEPTSLPAPDGNRFAAREIGKRSRPERRNGEVDGRAMAMAKWLATTSVCAVTSSPRIVHERPLSNVRCCVRLDWQVGHGRRPVGQGTRSGLQQRRRTVQDWEVANSIMKHLFICRSCIVHRRRLRGRKLSNSRSPAITPGLKIDLRDGVINGVIPGHVMLCFLPHIEGFHFWRDSPIQLALFANAIRSPLLSRALSFAECADRVYITSRPQLPPWRFFVSCSPLLLSSPSLVSCSRLLAVCCSFSRPRCAGF
jgi:hypothetical protein